MIGWLIDLFNDWRDFREVRRYQRLCGLRITARAPRHSLAFSAHRGLLAADIKWWGREINVGYRSAAEELRSAVAEWYAGTEADLHRHD